MLWFGDAMHAGWGIAGMVMMGVFWIGLLALVWMAISRLTGARSGESPDEILRARLARGEIDAEEFRRLRDELRA